MTKSTLPTALGFAATLMTLIGICTATANANQLVKIRVLHPISGQPVQGASARIYSFEKNNWTNGNPAIIGGEWSQMLAAGTYKVQARGYGMHSTEKTFTVGSQPLTVDIKPAPIPQPVTIRILHPGTGKPVHHASLRIYSRAEKRWIVGTTINGGVWNGKLVTGHYRVQGKGANMYSVEQTLLVGDLPVSLDLTAKTAP